MSTVEDIERAVRQLDPEDLATFRDWFGEFVAEAWDRQIEETVTRVLFGHAGVEHLIAFRNPVF